MIQHIDTLDMKEGEIYFIKNHYFIIGEVLFVKYHQNNIHTFIVFRYPYKSGCSYVHVKDISVYRYIIEEEYWAKVKEKYYKYVTREEFYKKVKEKYDAKCLDIVLKRLVNETFKW